MSKRNAVAKDLRTEKYRMRVVGDKKRKPPKHPKRDIANALL